MESRGDDRANDGDDRANDADGRPAKRQRNDEAGEAPSPPSSPEELIPAAARGDAAMVASALRNPLTDPNMTGEHGRTALMLAAKEGHAPVVTLLLADERVNPNMASL